jgi:phosphoribosylformylglycinamidine cyclo-ligase
VLPPVLDAEVDPVRWERPRIFDEIQRLGGVSDEEMAKVFNLGIGMVLVVPADDATRALDLLRTEGHLAVEIGRLVEGRGEVRFSGRSR